jgi:PAS domain S-box-containing protein
MVNSYKMEENSWELYINNSEKRKPKLKSPTIVDSEIQLDKEKVLLSITDTKGIITYCNEDFVETSGYDEWELAGAAHNIIRHPDMPRVIFKLMWQRIQNKNNIIAIVKNLAKSGKYYWVMTDFVIKEDQLGNIIGYKAYRRPAPRKAIETVIPLYKKLRKIEESKGMAIAEEFLVGYLDGKETTYDDFIENLIIDSVTDTAEEIVNNEKKNILTKTEKKSFFKRLFGN